MRELEGIAQITDDVVRGISKKHTLSSSICFSEDLSNKNRFNPAICTTCGALVARKQ